jgi:excisionase family DNA binding protein
MIEPSPSSELPRRGLRIQDFCAAYGVSRATVYKMMKDGTLRGVLIGGRRIIPVAEGERLLSGVLGTAAGDNP